MVHPGALAAFRLFRSYTNADKDCCLEHLAMTAQGFVASQPCRATSGNTCSTSGQSAAPAWTAPRPPAHGATPSTSRPQRSVGVQASRMTASVPPSKAEKERLASLGGVVTDAAVPEGHKGLHGFLYGEDGAEEHDARQYSIRHVRRHFAPRSLMNWRGALRAAPSHENDRCLSATTARLGRLLPRSTTRVPGCRRLHSAAANP